MSSPEVFVIPNTWRLTFALTFCLPLFVPGALELLDATPPDLRDLPAGRFGIAVGSIPVLLALLGLLLAGVSWPLMSSRVVVSDEGLTMYGIWSLSWKEVTSARKRTCFGSQYLYVSLRGRWIGWWVPLYFRGKRPLSAALRERAPAGSPIRLCLSEVAQLEP